MIYIEIMFVHSSTSSSCKYIHIWETVFLLLVLPCSICTQNSDSSISSTSTRSNTSSIPPSSASRYPKFFGSFNSIPVLDKDVSSILDQIASKYQPPKPPSESHLMDATHNATVPGKPVFEQCVPSLIRKMNQKLFPSSSPSSNKVESIYRKEILSLVQDIASVKQSLIGGTVVQGRDVVNGYFGCGTLPVIANQSYVWYRPLHGATSGMERFMAPVLKQFHISGYGSLKGVIMGGCALTNCDTFAISFLPAFIPLVKTGALSLARSPMSIFLAGIGFSSNNSLAHNITAVTVWDGLQTDSFTPQGSFWLQAVLFAKAVLPFPTIPGILSNFLHIAPLVSIFSGKSNTDGSRNMFITVESFQLMFAYVIPVFNFGSGNGGIRTIRKDDAHGDICTPSGIFVRVAPDLSSPALGSIVSGYLGEDWFFAQGDVDLAIKFTSTAKGNFSAMEKDDEVDEFDMEEDPFSSSSSSSSTRNKTSKRFHFNPTSLSNQRIRSLQMRAYANLVILGIPFFRSLIEIQYLNPEEIQKRKWRRMKSFGCSCHAGFDERGMCRDDVSPAERWIHGTNVNHHILTISAKASAHLPFGLVDINNATFIFAVPLDASSNQVSEKPFLLIGGLISVLCVRNIGGFLTLQHPSATMNVTGKVSGLVEVSIQGRADTSHLNVPHSWNSVFAATVKTASSPQKRDVVNETMSSNRNQTRNTLSTRLSQISNRIQQYFDNEDKGNMLTGGNEGNTRMTSTRRVIWGHGKGMLGKWSFQITIRFGRLVNRIWTSILSKIRAVFSPIWNVILSAKRKVQNLVSKIKRDMMELNQPLGIEGVLSALDNVLPMNQHHPSPRHAHLVKRSLSQLVAGNHSVSRNSHSLVHEVESYHSEMKNIPESVRPFLLSMNKTNKTNNVTIPPIELESVFLPHQVNVPLRIQHNKNMIQTLSIPWSCPKPALSSPSQPSHNTRTQTFEPTKNTSFHLAHAFHFDTPDAFETSLSSFHQQLESKIWNQCFS